jgi:hypothetical protein
MQARQAVPTGGDAADTLLTGRNLLWRFQTRTRKEVAGGGGWERHPKAFLTPQDRSRLPLTD